MLHIMNQKTKYIFRIKSFTLKSEKYISCNYIAFIWDISFRLESNYNKRNLFIGNSSKKEDQTYC